MQAHYQYKKEDYQEFASDNEEIMKLGYARYTIKLENGFQFKVGIARKFNSNLKVNLQKEENLKDIVGFFDSDIEINCYGNPSIVHSLGDNEGLDFLISYNGNITTWGNDQPYGLNNLYVHSYDEVLSRSLENVISYSFIEKGFRYRESIFDEINHKAVLRAKAVNIRDYSGNLLFDELSSVLYYGVRVIQDYLDEKILLPENLSELSEELQEAIQLSREKLIQLEKSSNYTIIEQYKEDETKLLVDWEDLLELVRLGHYEISEKKVKEAIEYVNLKFGTNYQTLDEFQFTGEAQYVRLLNRISGIAKEAL